MIGCGGELLNANSRGLSAPHIPDTPQLHFMSFDFNLVHLQYTYILSFFNFHNPNPTLAATSHHHRTIRHHHPLHNQTHCTLTTLMCPSCCHYHHAVDLMRLICKNSFSTHFAESSGEGYAMLRGEGGGLQGGQGGWEWMVSARKAFNDSSSCGDWGPSA